MLTIGEVSPFLAMSKPELTSFFRLPEYIHLNPLVAFVVTDFISFILGNGLYFILVVNTFCLI
jgi:hypothetical protein